MKKKLKPLNYKQAVYHKKRGNLYFVASKTGIGKLTIEQWARLFTLTPSNY